MSMNIPKSFTKEEFQRLIRTLGNDRFQHYKTTITDNYRENRTSGNYILREELSEEVLVNIDFIFKRIGYKEFNSIRAIAEDYWTRKNTLFYLLIMEQVKHDFLVNSSL